MVIWNQSKKGERWGFINRDGTWVIQPTYYLVTKFHEGIAGVETDTGWTFITSSGQYLRAPNIENVSGGGDDYYAVVRQGEDSWTYLDRTASFFLPIPQSIPEGFSDGLLPLEENGKWGYADQNGGFVIQPTFDEARGFSESLAAVRIGSKWGYIDKTGAIVVQPQFGWANGFSEGLASVEVAPRRYGFIDTHGLMVIAPRMDEGGFFSESLAAVGINYKLGYIDRNGRSL